MKEYEQIEVTFDKPCKYRSAGRSYFFLRDCGELQLPEKHTEPVFFSDDMVSGVRVPRWLAVKTGLIETASPVPAVDTMSRYDWFLLGTTMALLTRNIGPRKAVYDAKIVVRTLLEPEE